jgi:transcriptional regulator with XRE-family HTH domain
LSASGSPTIRRRELGALLRALRTDRGWTIEQVAEQLMVSPSKVSRLETGRRGVSPRDIRDLCDLYGVTGERRQQLVELAAEGKERSWWQARNLPYSTYIGLESAAASISDFGHGLIPGLLQTEEYARAVLRAIRPEFSQDLIEQRLTGRMDRQRLLTSPDPPQFEALIDEAALRRVAGSPVVMRAQLHHLLELSALPNVSVGVLPFEAGVLPAPNSKFIILTFAQPTVADVVFIEGLTWDLYLEQHEDVDAYRNAFLVMSGLAPPEDRSHAMIASIAATFDG